MSIAKFAARRYAPPHQHEAGVRQTRSNRRRCGNEIRVIFLRIEACHHANDNMVVVQAPCAPEFAARFVLALEVRGIEAIRYQREQALFITHPGVHLYSHARVADDAFRQPSRRQCTGAHDKPCQPTNILRAKARLPHVPDQQALARQAGRNTADQVRVVHPGLHDNAGPCLAQQANQANDGGQAVNRGSQPEGPHNDTFRSQALPDRTEGPQ